MSPIRRQPKSLDGRTARELFTVEQTTDNGGEELPPARLAEPGPVDLALHAQTGWRRKLVAQPSAATDYFRASRPKFDARVFTHVRLVSQVRSAGAATSYAFLEYTATPDDDNSWATPGENGVPVIVPWNVASGGDIAGTPVPLVSGALGDVWWRARAAGGDGVESSEIARLSAQFFQFPTVRTERWYWRPGTPGVVPALDAYTGFIRQSSCTPAEPLTHFTTPLDATVAASPALLSRTKNSGIQQSLSGNTTTAATDWYGPLKRFVGPALRAQTVPPFIYRVACAVQAVSANVDAGYAHVRFGYYRPSTEEIVAAAETTNTDAWARFVSRGRFLPVLLGSVELETGDRPFLDVWGSIRTGCGAANAQGFPLFVMYDGNDDTFADGDDMTGRNTASYIDMPRLSYVDYEP